MKQEGKTWRFSRKKFYEKLDLFLDQGLDEYIKELSTMEKLDSFHRDILKASIKARKEHYEITDSKKIKHKCRIDKSKALSNNVKDWANFSTKPEKLEDIAFRVIIFEKFGISLCCLNYICQYSHLPEDFIDDIIFITSGQFSFSKWDDVHVHAIVKSIEDNDFKNENLLRLFPAYKGNKKLRNRIGWNEIYKYQKLSSEFKKSHINFFKNNKSRNNKIS